MESRNIWNVALVSCFFTIVAAATTKKPVPAHKETFTITINFTPGVSDPATWIIEGERSLPDNIIKRMLRLDNHGADHPAHGGHAGHDEMKKSLSTLKGYQGITIDHKETSGFSHTMILPRCDDPFLEWDIIAKTFPSGKQKNTLSTEIMAYVKKLLRTCVLKKRAAAAAAGKGTTGKHEHASHAH